jgi:threonine/homoserine/homoserine lactone efflux protein
MTMMLLDGIHDLPLFIGAGLLLNITPGADVALIAARSSAQGFRAGAAAALGIGAGCMLHALAAALGVSALLASSATAFTLVRWIGAAYLVWLGIAMLRSRAAPAVATAAPVPTRWGRVFAQGFLTNALNPKVALFFLAFVPQFIDALAPNKALAFVVLGVIFNINGTLVNLGFAWGIAALRQRFQRGSGRVGLWLTRGAGALFVAMGLRLALADAPAR